ncbi:uncharacterized protein RBU57_009632 isoform 2-T7 [Macrochelys suwanniensis]
MEKASSLTNAAPSGSPHLVLIELSHWVIDYHPCKFSNKSGGCLSQTYNMRTQDGNSRSFCRSRCSGKSVYGPEPKPSLAFLPSLNFREVWIHIRTVQLPPVSDTNQTKTPHPNSSDILGCSDLDPNIARWAHLYCSPSANGKGRLLLCGGLTIT